MKASKKLAKMVRIAEETANLRGDELLIAPADKDGKMEISVPLYPGEDVRVTIGELIQISPRSVLGGVDKSTVRLVVIYRRYRRHGVGHVIALNQALITLQENNSPDHNLPETIAELRNSVIEDRELWLNAGMRAVAHRLDWHYRRATGHRMSDAQRDKIEALARESIIHAAAKA